MDDERDITENEDGHSAEEVEVVPDAEHALPDMQARIKRLRDDMARSEKERAEYLDGWQRAKADLINYKKDEGRRLEEFMKFAGAAMAEDLLPVLDSFDLALAGAPGGAGALEQGMRIIRSQLEDMLKKRGVAAIAVHAGEPFNPEKHEAIGQMQSEYPAGVIAEVSQRGYEIAGRIIRPARVRLAQ